MSWTYGINAVQGLLEQGADTIDELLLVKSRKPGGARRRIRELAEREGVRFKMVSDEAIKRVLGDVVHQGVAARVASFEYADPASLIDPAGDRVIVVLDEVQDPHNLGAIMRSAWGFGAAGVVIARHRAASVTPVARKVAAGAAQHVPVAQVRNIADFIADAKERGFWTWAADMRDAQPAHTVDLTGRVVIVVGSEGKGVRRRVRQSCDGAVQIPITGVESLNVSVAAGVLLYEAQRQRTAVAATK